MVGITRGMLTDALVAYVTRNDTKARRVYATDDKFDVLNGSIFQIVYAPILEDPRRIRGGLDLLPMSQNLKRIGDLAMNISEGVVFLLEGRTITHGHDVDDDETPV